VHRLSQVGIVMVLGSNVHRIATRAARVKTIDRSRLDS
jgi:hypothetical protein